jgi:transcriptional regulator with XRE-family HTH domain
MEFESSSSVPSLRTHTKAETSSSPVTLAERIRFWREQRYLTPALLALKTRLPLKTIEDIEAGIETFLSPTVRQRIARILHVRPSQIKELENPPKILPGSADAPVLQQRSVSLHDAILRDPDEPQVCPLCQASLQIRVFERRDLHNRPLLVIKASCTACLFRLSDD